MKKTEIPKAKDNELMVDYIETYSSILLNYNLNRSTKQLESHAKDLETEIVKRGLLTADDVERLNR